MQNSDDDPAAASAEADGKSDALLRAFALALGRELDRIGYPAAPARTNLLSQDLGLGRMQAYRIGRGDNMPTLKALLKFHSLGVSLDSVFAALLDAPAIEEEISIDILGQRIKALPLPAYSRTPFAVTRFEGRATLRVLKLGEELGAEDIPMGGLRFTRPQPRVAVVDDDPADLHVLGKEIGEGFDTHLFLRAHDLLEGWHDLVEYDALVIDWRLADMEGAELVRQIRAKTLAPIIVTTGERREGQAISAVLHLPNVRYVSKPVDGAIVRTMIESAIADVGTLPSSAAAWATKPAQPSE